MANATPLDSQARTRGRRKLLLILVICLAPVIASYVSYYFIHPEGRSNYSDLIEPQRPIPSLGLKTLEGEPFDLASLRGKWIMVMVAPGDCPTSCTDRLYHMRQVRTTTGKDRDRIERVWIIPDNQPLPTIVMREYDGTVMVRGNPGTLRAWLPATTQSTMEDHIYIVDPIGNLMMRFPKNADPSQTKKDVSKLLMASSIG